MPETRASHWLGRCDLCQLPAGDEYLSITQAKQSIIAGTVHEAARAELARVCPECHDRNPDWWLAWLSVMGITQGPAADALHTLCQRCGELVDRIEPHAAVEVVHVYQDHVVQSAPLAILCPGCATGRDAVIPSTPLNG